MTLRAWLVGVQCARLPVITSQKFIFRRFVAGPGFIRFDYSAPASVPARNNALQLNAT